MAKESKGWALLGIIFGVLGFLIVMLTRKNDKYAMYYAKQGLVLNIAAAIVWIAGIIVPVLGWFIILPIGSILIGVLWIIGIVNSLSGKMKPTPIVGKFADKLKF